MASRGVGRHVICLGKASFFLLSTLFTGRCRSRDPFRSCYSGCAVSFIPKIYKSPKPISSQHLYLTGNNIKSRKIPFPVVAPITEIAERPFKAMNRAIRQGAIVAFTCHYYMHGDLRCYEEKNSEFNASGRPNILL